MILLNRLLRLYPYSIQTNERTFNAFRTQSDTANKMAKYLWFGHVFDELDKNAFNIRLELIRILYSYPFKSYSLSRRSVGT